MTWLYIILIGWLVNALIFGISLARSEGANEDVFPFIILVILVIPYSLVFCGAIALLGMLYCKITGKKDIFE